ncbi:hypothetical protein ES288_A05G361200v1 [Gossypium darwinii]|uniref:Uncharacterized protein n=1 Tax=Gossypium darwinii TaxID=34276 RepID=A0A5D2GNB0_GOSDA|nr:hypothetical protein ES288_A05G361200v1 [Gossypium darwinii]
MALKYHHSRHTRRRRQTTEGRRTPLARRIERLYSQNTSSFCCFLVQLARREVVENEGRGVWAQTWSGAHEDRAWSVDVGAAAWVT